MSEERPPDPLARLGDRIDKARRARLQEGEDGRGGPPRGALGFGLRIATELVAALCVGGALGWLSFRFLAAPWGAIGLIVFFFLGIAAGLLNVFRAAKGVGYGNPPPGDRGPDRK